MIPRINEVIDSLVIASTKRPITTVIDIYFTNINHNVNLSLSVIFNQPTIG